MGRSLRPDLVGGWYHVVNRGAARQPIFFDDRDRFEFERLLGVAHRRFGVTTHAYCWMTNHYHLLLHCPDGHLSEVMHLIGSVYVRHVNERQGRDGPLFRDRFFSKPVTSNPYLIRLVRYIHRNPLAFIPADRLATYRWSSLRAYAGDRRAPGCLVTDEMLDLVGGRERFERLIFDSDHSDLGPVDPSDWLDAVDLVIDEFGAVSHARRARRTIAALLLDRSEVCHDQLAALLQFPNREAERAAVSRARRQLRDRPELADIVASVVQLAA